MTFLKYTWRHAPASRYIATFNFNDTILTISTTWRLFIYASAVLIKTRTKVCHGITAHTLWRFHGEHQVNTKRGLGGVVYFAFIIKRILGIKRISPCNFGNKRMCFLTRVYGMCFINAEISDGCRKHIWVLTFNLNVDFYLHETATYLSHLGIERSFFVGMSLSEPHTMFAGGGRFWLDMPYWPSYVSGEYSGQG